MARSVVDHLESLALSVLIVDDTDDIRLLLRITLGLDERFDVVGEATNGREAIDAAASLCPDIVLLDVMMPVMSGMEALPEIRRRCPRARVFMHSADVHPAAIEEALRLGAAGFVPKSTSIEDLKEVLAGDAATKGAVAIAPRRVS